MLDWRGFNKTPQGESLERYRSGWDRAFGSRASFSGREDNPDHFDPEMVLRLDALLWSGVHFNGGGLPMGSGALITAAREIIEQEKA